MFNFSCVFLCVLQWSVVIILTRLTSHCSFILFSLQCTTWLVLLNLYIHNVIIAITYPNHLESFSSFQPIRVEIPTASVRTTSIVYSRFWSHCLTVRTKTNSVTDTAEDFYYHSMFLPLFTCITNTMLSITTWATGG